MPSAQGAGSTRGHVTAPPLRFGTGLVTPEQSGGGRLERAQARQPTTWQRHHAAALRAAGLYITRGAKGGHGGKVRFPPCSMCMAFTKKQSAFPLAGGALCAMPILRAELPCANSNTRGEALRCRARRGLGRVSLHKRCSDSPQGIGGCRVAPSTKPPHRRRRWGERL